MKWSVQIIALDSVGMRSYDVRSFEGTMSETMQMISLLSKLPRPLVIGTEETCYWLHHGDVLVAVPVEDAS